MASKGNAGRGKGKWSGPSGDLKTNDNRYGKGKGGSDSSKTSEEEECIREIVRNGWKCFRLGFGKNGYWQRAKAAIERAAKGGCIDVPGINREFVKTNTGDEAYFQVVDAKTASKMEALINIEDPVTREKHKIQWVRLAGTLGTHAGWLTGDVTAYDRSEDPGTRAQRLTDEFAEYCFEHGGEGIKGCDERILFEFRNTMTRTGNQVWGASLRVGIEGDKAVAITLCKEWLEKSYVNSELVSGDLNYEEKQKEYNHRSRQGSGRAQGNQNDEWMRTWLQMSVGVEWAETEDYSFEALEMIHKVMVEKGYTQEEAEAAVESVEVKKNNSTAGYRIVGVMDGVSSMNFMMGNRLMLGEMFGGFTIRDTGKYGNSNGGNGGAGVRGQSYGQNYGSNGAKGGREGFGGSPGYGSASQSWEGGIEVEEMAQATVEKMVEPEGSFSSLIIQSLWRVAEGGTEAMAKAAGEAAGEKVEEILEEHKESLSEAVSSVQNLVQGLKVVSRNITGQEVWEEGERENLEGQISKLKEELGESINGAEEAKMLRETMEEEHAKVKSKVSDMEERMKNMLVKTVDMDAQGMKVRRERGEAVEAVRRMEEQMKKMKEDHSMGLKNEGVKVRAEVDGQMKKLEQENKRLEKEMKKLEQENKKLEQEKKKWEGEKKRCEHEEKLKRKEIVDMKEDMKKFQQQTRGAVKEKEEMEKMIMKWKSGEEVKGRENAGSPRKDEQHEEEVKSDGGKIEKKNGEMEVDGDMKEGEGEVKWGESFPKWADEKYGKGPQKWHTVGEPEWNGIGKESLEEFGADVKERISVGKKELKYGCIIVSNSGEYSNDFRKKWSEDRKKEVLWHQEELKKMEEKVSSEIARRIVEQGRNLKKDMSALGEGAERWMAAAKRGEEGSQMEVDEGFVTPPLSPKIAATAGEEEKGGSGKKRGGRSPSGESPESKKMTKGDNKEGEVKEMTEGGKKIPEFDLKEPSMEMEADEPSMDMMIQDWMESNGWDHDQLKKMLKEEGEESMMKKVSEHYEKKKT